jgi:hypothetical protein
MRVSIKPYAAIVIILVATLAGCSSSTSGKNSNSELTFPIEFLGIADSRCYAGSFQLNITVKNLLDREIAYEDIEGLGIDVLLKDLTGKTLVSLPFSFYGIISGPPGSSIKPSRVGALMMADDGYKGTLATVEVEVNGENVFQTPVNIPAPLRDRNWVIKDGICG